MLGIGGMGAVYQAWDAELGVVVALKVIRPEVAADPDATRMLERRFKQELLLARQVTHRNVVRIHDLGEINGIKYITMPFIEGEDLATVLRRDTKVPLATALRISRTIASGLEAAHAAGVVHRDLKPANIMVDTAGEAMIMDFGVARSTGTGAPGGPGQSSMSLGHGAAAGHTVMGAVVGTVEYMAPEQARAQPVDQRADMYAFGLILYDMLLGRRRAQHAESAIAELTKRMETPPPPVRSIDPSVPEPVDRIISRCIQPEAEKRYETTAQLVAALDELDDAGRLRPKARRVTRRLVAGVASVVVALLGLTWWLARGPAPVVDRPPMSVLVADFENTTGETVFDGALEQGLALALEGASFVSAYPHATAQQLATQIKPGSRVDEQMARLIARREGIQVIVAGSIARERSGYRVAVRAVDPAVEGETSPLSTASATAATREEVLSAIASIASRVRGDLGDATPESTRLAAADTFTASSLEAVRTYSIAQDFHSRGRKAEALDAYKQAIAQDPNFGIAYSGAAIMAFELGRTQEAEGLWKQMLTLQERMSEREKYRALAGYYLLGPKNYKEAITNYEALIEKYPADRSAHANLALAYFWSLDMPKALEYGRRAAETDTKNLLHRSNYALYAMYAGDFATATKETSQVLEKEPGFFVAYLPLAMAALDRGDVAAAEAEYARMAKASTAGASLAALGLADAALYQGRAADALAILTNGITADQQAGNAAGVTSKEVALAETYEALGNRAQAITTAKRALASGKGQIETEFPALSVLLRLGQHEMVASAANEISQRLQPQVRAYGRILQGRVALATDRRADAVDTLTAARQLGDLWMTRFDVGVAYAEAGHYAEALAAFEECRKRRGEATAVFLNDLPTYRYLAPLPYWTARAQDGLGMRAAAVANYDVFLKVRAAGARDPLAADARKRIAAR